MILTGGTYDINRRYLWY